MPSSSPSQRRPLSHCQHIIESSALVSCHKPPDTSAWPPVGQGPGQREKRNIGRATLEGGFASSRLIACAGDMYVGHERRQQAVMPAFTLAADGA